MCEIGATNFVCIVGDPRNFIGTDPDMFSLEDLFADVDEHTAREFKEIYLRRVLIERNIARAHFLTDLPRLRRKKYSGEILNLMVFFCAETPQSYLEAILFNTTFEMLQEVL
jgi:hypothetical protein